MGGGAAGGGGGFSVALAEGDGTDEARVEALELGVAEALAEGVAPVDPVDPEVELVGPVDRVVAAEASLSGALEVAGAHADAHADARSALTIRLVKGGFRARVTGAHSRARGPLAAMIEAR